MSYQIHNLHRLEHDGVFYEFWAIRTMSEPWTGHPGKTTFYITLTADIYQQREILVKETQFKAQYELQGLTFNVPVNDLDMLYRLQPWRYPNNYLHTDIDETELYMNSRGEIKKKWWQWP